MPERHISLRFPEGGLDKKRGYQQQPPYGTPSAKNVWLAEPGTGRERGAVRAPLSSSIATIGAPYFACEATWTNSGAKRGLAITTANGTYLVYYSGSWTATEWITTNPGTTFASCAVFLTNLYQARGGGTTLFITMSSGSGGAGAALGNGGGGTAPTNCGVVIAHQDRLKLAGDTSNPYTFYESATGDPTNWDFAATVATAAVTGTVPEPITSWIPHTIDCSIIGCTDSLYLERGNLADGGDIYPLKAPVGPLMQSAWCHIGNGTLLFMTRQGLFSMAAGCGEEPVIVSQNQIPNDLKGIDPGAGDWCSLGYCSRWDAVDIIVNKASGSDNYYRYFLSEGGSFWPMEFASTMQLAANIKYKSSLTTSPLLLLTSSGAIHQYDTDASETIDSHLVYGPFPISGPSTKATITEFSGVLSETSGACTPTIYVADSAQQAAVAAIAGSSPDFTCANLAAGLNGTENPRINGTAACLRIDDASGAHWSSEEFVLTTNGDGARKKS